MTGFHSRRLMQEISDRLWRAERNGSRLQEGLV